MHLLKVSVTAEQTVDNHNSDHNDDMVVESDTVIYLINDIEVDEVGKGSNTIIYTRQSSTISIRLMQQALMEIYQVVHELKQDKQNMVMKHSVKGKSIPGKKKSNTNSDISSDESDESRRSSISIESSIILIYQSNLIKSIYNTILRYNRDSDTQKLLEFKDKIESYFKIIELIPLL